MTAAAIIMAQVGCYVPAESATLVPMERILTRMGAVSRFEAVSV
jgi:DNA mismatch repair protein MSH6